MATEIGIGELSRQTRCNIETIRYYERIGLLPKARREKSGRFRRYDADDISRLRFVRRARELGFTVDGVRGLLRLAVADGDDVRSRIRSLAMAHVADIRVRIADLLALERVLTEAICACEDGARAHVADRKTHPQMRCPLIEVLSGDVGEPVLES